MYVMFSCQMKEVAKFLGSLVMNFVITDALYCISSPEVVLRVFKVHTKGKFSIKEELNVNLLFDIFSLLVHSK